MRVVNNKLDLSTMEVGDILTIVTTSRPPEVSVRDESGGTGGIKMGIRVNGHHVPSTTGGPLFDLSTLPPDHTLRVIRMPCQYWEIIDEGGSTPPPVGLMDKAKAFFGFGRG